jgi:hypothetical protein
MDVKGLDDISVAYFFGVGEWIVPGGCWVVDKTDIPGA